MYMQWNSHTHIIYLWKTSDRNHNSAKQTKRESYNIMPGLHILLSTCWQTDFFHCDCDDSIVLYK